MRLQKEELTLTALLLLGEAPEGGDARARAGEVLALRAARVLEAVAQLLAWLGAGLGLGSGLGVGVGLGLGLGLVAQLLALVEEPAQREDLRHPHRRSGGAPLAAAAELVLAVVGHADGAGRDRRTW